MGTNTFLLTAFSIAVVLCGVTQAAVSQPRTPLVRSIGSFKSNTHPDVGLRFVRNSGVCETTPGVGQLSGYIDFGTNMSMVRSLSSSGNVLVSYGIDLVVLVLRGKRESRDGTVHALVRVNIMLAGSCLSS